jgi:hypothetical protein
LIFSAKRPVRFVVRLFGDKMQPLTRFKTIFLQFVALLELFWTRDFPELTFMIRRVTEKPFELATKHGHVGEIGAIRKFDHIDVHAGDK